MREMNTYCPLYDILLAISLICASAKQKEQIIKMKRPQGGLPIGSDGGVRHFLGLGKDA